MHKVFTTCVLIVFSFSLEASVQSPHPVKKIRGWFNAEREKSDRGFHRFATLSTVGLDGHPYSGMIEIKGMSKKKGILFFTHRNTEKAEHFSLNSHAALNIWLPRTLRQISINGHVEEIPKDEAEKSWKRMSRFMKLTFLSSNHRGPLSSPKLLEERKAKLAEIYKDDIPMPDTYVGYRLQIDRALFYQIKPRHFPIKEVVELDNNDSWTICQLEP